MNKIKTALQNLAFLALVIFAFSQKIDGLQNIVVAMYWLLAFSMIGYLNKDNRNKARENRLFSVNESGLIFMAHFFTMIYFSVFVTAAVYFVAAFIQLGVKFSDIEE